LSGTPPTSHAAILRGLVRLWAVVGGIVALVTVVVLLTSDASSTVPAALPVVLTAALALGATSAVVAVDRSFVTNPPDDDLMALHELRTRSFLQLAILEAPALLGVALGFTLGPPWVAAVGAAGSLASLVLARPTRGRLARFDAAWREGGHDVSLLRGLDAPASPAG
jgi:hypothetical protein